MYDVYQKKIREVESERDKAIEDVRNKAHFEEEKRQEKIKELMKPVKQVERILEFMRQDTKGSIAVKDEDIHTRNGDYKEALGYYYKDDYLKAKLFIIENGKPKNKYSLVVYGKCSFSEAVLTLPRHFVNGAYTSGNRYNLEVSLRDFPSIAEAKTWLERVGSKLDILEGYQAVKQEYIETKQAYSRRMFNEFIILRCKCGYFFTTFDKRNYSSRYFEVDEVTCPRCRAVLKPAVDS